LVIEDTLGRVNRVYFFDLIGAAGGCAVLIPLLNWVGGPNTILVAAVLFAVSAAIWFHLARDPWGRVAGVLIGLLLVALVTYNSRSSNEQRSEEHTSELQSLAYLVCRLLLEKKNINTDPVFK